MKKFDFIFTSEQFKKQSSHQKYLNSLRITGGGGIALRGEEEEEDVRTGGGRSTSNFLIFSSVSF